MKQTRNIADNNFFCGLRAYKQPLSCPTETVTISSDEDETSPTKTAPTPPLPPPATQAQTLSIQSSQGVQASLVQAAVSGSKSPAAGTPGECPESPLIPTIPISTKRTALSRLQKMEDEVCLPRTTDKKE